MVNMENEYLESRDCRVDTDKFTYPAGVMQ